MHADCTSDCLPHQVVAELELIFPTASRVRIERALDAAIQIGGDRNEAALLLLEPDEV